MNTEIVSDMPGTRRDEMSGTSLTTTGETSSSALAAQAQAQVQARFIVAMQRPRDLDDVRARLLKECKRSGFAEVAIYHKPIGKGIEGLSVRFAEAALRCMRNVSVETVTTYDDPTKRMVRVTVIDIESNSSYFTDVVLDKTVERNQLKSGQVALSQRQNSRGVTTYLVAATEDELLNKQNALISKALRTNGLRLIPGDILDECKRTIKQVQERGDAADPDAARKKLCDAFAELGVMPSDLKELLGHDVGSASPAEISRLRGIYVGIRDGETTWRECLGKDTKGGKKAAADDVAAELLGKKSSPKSSPAATNDDDVADLLGPTGGES